MDGRRRVLRHRRGGGGMGGGVCDTGRLAARCARVAPLGSATRKTRQKDISDNGQGPLEDIAARAATIFQSPRGASLASAALVSRRGRFIGLGDNG